MITFGITGAKNQQWGLREQISKPSNQPKTMTITRKHIIDKLMVGEQRRPFWDWAS